VNTQNASGSPSNKPERSVAGENITEQAGAGINPKSAYQVQTRSRGMSKADARFWLRPGKMRKPDGRAAFSFQFQIAGKRHTFSARTGNREAAARVAARIYGDFVEMGVEAAERKHRAQNEEPAKVATVGEWIAAARTVSEANAGTFNCYQCSLRKIVGDIVGVRRTKTRFGPGKGGAAAYRAELESVSLDVLSAPAVQKWRLEYVKRGRTPAQERSRMTSCNSTIRQARSLFAPKIVKFLPDVRLPDPLPFAGVEFFPKQSAKYFSRIDARALLQAAHRDLATRDEPAFIAMLLALSAGLRRGEIDSLCWHQIDFGRQLIRVESTDAAHLKTTDSRDEVALDENVIALLRGFRAKASGDAFVIHNDAARKANSGPGTYGQRYRADAVFDRLNAWLRTHGVKARKPLHELRKELGSLVTAEFGIYAASRVLRHSNVATTAAHYSDLKSRPVVNVGAWLQPENVEPFPSAMETSVKSARKRVKGGA
jgi:integrase